MKILIVTASFYPDLNGPVIYFDNVSKEFSRRGHKITIICSGEREGIEKRGKVRLLRYKKPSNKLSPKRKYDWYCNKASEKIRKLNEKFDLVLSGSEIFIPSLKEKFDSNKICWIVPSLRNIAKNLGNKKESIKQIKRRIKKSIKGIKLIVVSNSLKKQFKKEFGRKNKIFIVNPGANLKQFKSPKKRKDNILFLGRMSTEKNVSILLSVFEKVSGGKLILVGGGPKLKEIKRKAKKSKRQKDIDIEGMRKDTPKFYSNAKIFVLPSKYDAFPLVLFEAMASGLPCIAFKSDDKKIITGSGELINSGVNGFLVDNTIEMTEKINLLLSNKKLWRKMSKAAKKTSKKYSWKITAKRILETLKSK